MTGEHRAENQPRSERGAMRMLWERMEGERLRYGAALLALIPSAALLYLAPMIPKVVLDRVLPEAEPTADGGVSGVLVEALGGRDFLRENLWIAAVCIVAVTAAAGAFTYLRGRLAARASERIVRRLRDRLYDHLQRLPIAWHHTANTGDLVQRATSDVETLRQFLATQVVEIGRAIAMFLVPLPLMLSIDPRMTAASVFLMPVIVGFSYFFFRRVRRAFLGVDEAEGALTGVIQENLVGIRVVRAFARQEHEEAKFAEKNKTHQSRDRRFYRNLSVFWSCSDLLCFVQLALVIGYGGFRLADGSLEVGTYYWFLASVNLFLWPMRFMGRILTEFGKATVAIGRIAEILETPEETQPEPGLVAAEDAKDARRGEVGREDWKWGEIEFENVRFAVEGGSPILDGVDFRIRAGETVALLGPSGAGKSTIARLLLRFIDPTDGVIRLDGRDIASLPRQRMRSRIAVVLQDPFLYSKTVRENIHIGRQSATMEEIEHAARHASIHDGIVDFADGYETMVGERGVTLSGGQRQRVSLARALVDRTDVLILDDALSAVDTDTEGWILDALRERRGRQTTILIAHRLSTLMNADRIFVLDEGRITQQGTHAELSITSGLYGRLWRLESRLEEEMFASDGDPSPAQDRLQGEAPIPSPEGSQR